MFSFDHDLLFGAGRSVWFRGWALVFVGLLPDSPWFGFSACHLRRARAEVLGHVLSDAYVAHDASDFGPKFEAVALRGSTRVVA